MIGDVAISLIQVISKENKDMYLGLTNATQLNTKAIFPCRN
jgi:hypothetical protein